MAAELVDSDAPGRLVGRVAACLWSWPALASPARRAGGPTAANVAAAVRANPADVEDVFARFKLGGPTRSERDDAIADAVRLGLMRRNARGVYDLTAAGKVAREIAWDGVFARIGLALTCWPFYDPDTDRTRPHAPRVPA